MRHYEHVIKVVLGLEDILREDSSLAGGGRITPLLGGPIEDYPSFIDRHPALYDVPPDEAAMMVGVLKSIYIGCMFVRGGRKVFQMSQPLAVALSQTEISRVPCELVKLPFDGMYIEFPQDMTLLTLPSSDDSGLTYRCEGVYCVRNDDRLDLMLAGMGKGTDDQTAYTTLHLQDGKDLNEILEESLGASDPDFDDIADVFGKRAAREVLRRASTLMFNVLLYISSPDADIADPVKGEATRKWEAHPNKSPEWRERMRRLALREGVLIKVGQNLKRDAGLEDCTRADLGDKRYELSARFRVRGHWRNQAVGKGLVDRKLIWIKPFIKGPSMAELVERNYRVE